MSCAFGLEEAFVAANSRFSSANSSFGRTHRSLSPPRRAHERSPHRTTSIAATVCSGEERSCREAAVCCSAAAPFAAKASRTRAETDDGGAPFPTKVPMPMPTLTEDSATSRIRSSCARLRKLSAAESAVSANGFGGLAHDGCNGGGTKRIGAVAPATTGESTANDIPE